MNTVRSYIPVRFAAFWIAALALAHSARAAFHQWQIRELYTNLDGSVQFIEFFTTFDSQNVVGGKTIQVVQQGTGVTHTFTIPTNLPSSTTGNHAFLIATGNISTLGGPTPNYVLPATFGPDNTPFLFPGDTPHNGGTITFFGANSGSYTALPNDGNLSYVFPAGTTQSNSPQNFAGTVGHVVPEPTTWGLIGIGGFVLCALLRRHAS
jgi:hypothetical protein